MKLEFNWKLKSYEYVSGSNSSKNWKSVPWLCSDFRSRNIRIPHLLRIQCISTWKVAFVQCQQSHSLAYSAIMLRGLVTSSEREREWLIWRDHPFGQSLGHDPFSHRRLWNSSIYSISHMTWFNTWSFFKSEVHWDRRYYKQSTIWQIDPWRGMETFLTTRPLSQLLLILYKI